MPSWKRVITSGSNAALNSLNVTTSLTASGIIYPTVDGTDNQVIKTDGNGNLFFDNVITTTISIKNVSGGTIAKGTPCYITGSGTSGNVAGVWPADASNPLRMPAGVIAGETLNNGDEGIGLLNGFINGVNTSDFNAGDSVYVAVGGGYTNVRPTGSSILIQKLGNVEKVDASNGSGVINGPGYYNEVPNIQQGFTWVGNSNGVATPIATSSIQNVVSSSFATNSTTAAQTSQAVTFNNGGAGAASGTTFNGSIARTISHNTIGAVPTGRTITINGTSQDLSANRTYNVGTVTSVGGTGTVSGLTLSGTVTSTGNLTLGGTLSVAGSNFGSQTANTFLAAPNGTAGNPTFRTIVAADIPTLNQNTTGTAANVTGTVLVANGGTGTTTHTSGNVLIGAGTSAITSLSRSGIDTRTTFPPAQHAISTHSATAWRMFFSNATTTAIQELAFGTAGQYLRSGGTTSNPTWSTIAYSELSGTPTIPTVNNGTLNLGVSGVGLSGNATFTANQSGTSTFTVTSNATSANTVSTVVSRDASGNFNAGTITATLNGNASTATTLQTARTINGTSFNGSANITTTNWGTTRTITIGSTGKSVNGSGNVSWSLAEIGAQAALTNPVTGTGADNRVAVWSGTTTQDSSANLTFDGTTLTASNITNSGTYTANSTSTRDKIRVWNSGTYTIGMQTGYTFGGLVNDYAMTFQMNDSNTRGFWWGDVNHTTANGAMALTTDGRLTVARALRIGYGEGDTTVPGDGVTINGDTNITGTLTATVKSFIIDHPTKEGKKLQYGVLEGPEHSVYVRGKLTNNNTIILPDHWTGLVHEDTITVNLTPIGKRQDLWVETVTDTTITVGSDNEINCFYTVFAERKDIEKLVTEFDK